MLKIHRPKNRITDELLKFRNVIGVSPVTDSGVKHSALADLVTPAV
jgi:hypothetical protein